MSKLQVLTRGEASKLGVLDVPYAVISIKNPGMDDVVFEENDNLLGVLKLAFDDASMVENGVLLFSYEMAYNVWNFVIPLWEKVTTFIIHCNMGLSRSPAIAAAIGKVFEGDDSVWFTTKVPNTRVYKMMLRTARKKGIWTA